MWVYQLLVVGFEVAIVGLMKPNQNRHDLAQAQTARSSASLQAVTQQLAFPLRFKRLAKVIDAAKQFF